MLFRSGHNAGQAEVDMEAVIQGDFVEDCTFDPACDRAFEDTTLNATIRGHITEIKNPISGHIVADSIGRITIDEHIKQPANCKIETK